MAYSYKTDLEHARRLAAHLRAAGVSVSIELQPGAKNTGWLDARHRLNMSHHTVSRPSMGLTPCLSLVKKGRPDVPGPLCNGYGGYDRVYRIITMGWANHPGAGGPLTLDGITIPRDNGRPYFWGTEFEGGLEDWTPEMHEFMARSNAGITAWLREDHDRTIDANAEHSTWAPIRKIDRRDYTRAKSIARIRPHLKPAATPNKTLPDASAIPVTITDRKKKKMNEIYKLDSPTAGSLLVNLATIANLTPLLTHVEGSAMDKILTATTRRVPVTDEELAAMSTLMKRAVA